MSKYEQFFIVNDDLWSCKLCSYEVIIKTKSRGSLHFHMKRHHKDKVVGLRGFESIARSSADKNTILSDGMKIEQLGRI